MSTWSKLKGTAGGTDRQYPTIASATTLVIPQTSNVFYVSGTTAITAISTAGGIQPGRTVTLLGFTATGPSITDTAASVTGGNGTLSLSAALSLARGSALIITQTNTGQWWEISRSANG